MVGHQGFEIDRERSCSADKLIDFIADFLHECGDNIGFRFGVFCLITL